MIEYENVKTDKNHIIDVLDLYSDALIIAVQPSCNIDKKIGSYRVALIYKEHRKTYEDTITNITSANRCALYGIIAAAKHITRPIDVVLFVTCSYGIKRGLAGKGPNRDLVLMLMSILYNKGCKKVTEILAPGAGYWLLG